MPVGNNNRASLRTSLDLADQFTLHPTFTPAMPSQREGILHALRLLVGIAVRMDQPAGPMPTHDLTCSPPEAIHAGPSYEEGSH